MGMSIYLTDLLIPGNPGGAKCIDLERGNVLGSLNNVNLSLYSVLYTQLPQ